MVSSTVRDIRTRPVSPAPAAYSLRSAALLLLLRERLHAIEEERRMPYVICRASWYREGYARRSAPTAHPTLWGVARVGRQALIHGRQRRAGPSCFGGPESGGRARLLRLTWARRRAISTRGLSQRLAMPCSHSTHSTILESKGRVLSAHIVSKPGESLRTTTMSNFLLIGRLAWFLNLCSRAGLVFESWSAPGAGGFAVGPGTEDPGPRGAARAVGRAHLG
jgi:hypothetical protein